VHEGPLRSVTPAYRPGNLNDNSAKVGSIKKTAPIIMIGAAYTHNLLSYFPGRKAGM